MGPACKLAPGGSGSARSPSRDHGRSSSPSCPRIGLATRMTGSASRSFPRKRRRPPASPGPTPGPNRIGARQAPKQDQELECVFVRRSKHVPPKVKLHPRGQWQVPENCLESAAYFSYRSNRAEFSENAGERVTQRRQRWDRLSACPTVPELL